MTSDSFGPIDLAPLVDAAGAGVHWTLDGSPDLNANLVRLEPNGAIGEHTNDAVDVLVVVLAGAGSIRIDGVDHPVGPLTVTSIPRGTRRRIQAGERPPGLTYLTVHRRRGLLTIAPPADRCDEGGEAPCLAHLLDHDGTVADPER
jgi:quercetin dioxygenase-like cupin family protein